MRNADRPSTRVGHLYHFVRLRIAAIGHIARENPRVTARNPVGGLSIHANSSQPAILA